MLNKNTLKTRSWKSSAWHFKAVWDSGYATLHFHGSGAFTTLLQRGKSQNYHLPILLREIPNYVNSLITGENERK